MFPKQEVFYCTAVEQTSEQLKSDHVINPVMPNGIPPLPYQLDKPSCWVKIYNYIQILKVHSVSKSVEPDQMSHLAESDLVLHCLPMSHKMDARLIWVNICIHVLISVIIA